MTYSNDRLDRIEELLAQSAIERREAHAQHEREMADMRQNLEATRAIVESNAQATQANSDSWEETKAIVESNARAIEANSNAIAETRATIDRATAEFRHDLAETRAIVDSAARSAQANSDASSDLRQALQVSTEQGDRQLRESINDTVTMIADLAQQQQDTNQQFAIFVEEARADRKHNDERAAANETEHRAFQQVTQTLLAEIARIWGRLAG